MAVCRSAYKRYCYDVQQFVIDKQETKCEQLARDSQQSPETCAAAVLVDQLAALDCASIGINDFDLIKKVLHLTLP